MARITPLRLLVVLNGFLLGGVVLGLLRGAQGESGSFRDLSVPPTRTDAPSSDLPLTRQNMETSRLPAEPVKGVVPEPATPFAAVYSSQPHEFARNLRRVGCPEETVKDILLAEVNRKYRWSEELLRPKPADHVPFTWSPKTSEARLVERRQQSAAIVREKKAMLRSALGYDVDVPMPLYAMTMSDLRFQETLERIPAPSREAAHRAQNDYWQGVQELRWRTQGFWESRDVQDLEELKRVREETLKNLTSSL